ncbi:hypothetical protein [Aquimarina litoralis]|uniref:hypothetical protein n=1 Tax=Aquimarina litoralis TaxID=584605 RepID=UPI001C59A367|nr:hypothetical protein [Aquimarina litoralis]MBW1296283.1 hypothetical protein [Aquimarina litoralis]
MEPNKIRLLDNYQLFQLIQSNSIDKTTVDKLKKEYNSRNINENEKLRLQQKYDLNFSKRDTELNMNQWDPLYTAFALNRHFRHIALLKALGRKKEAEKHMSRLYIGLALYFAGVILLILLVRSE